MTQKTQKLIAQLETALVDFTEQKKQQVQNILKSLKCQSEEQIEAINQILEKLIKKCLAELMNKGSRHLFAQLLEAFCESLSNLIIKKSIAIAMVEDILQCLGVNDLKSILNLISERVCSFQNLQINDQNRLLRVINHLLKRISKTQDYLTRGQLQFTLTKILPYCHDSGFHYRNSLAQAVQIIEDQENQEYNVFASEGITYQFYKDFWELQTYFMDPNQLANDKKTTKNNKSQSEQTRNKISPATSLIHQPVFVCRLKKIQKVLNELISYFNAHPVLQQCKILQQPIKFLTNTNLLQLQLNDAYFRKIIILQVLMFTFSLTYLKPAGNILKGLVLSQNQKNLISKVQKIALKYLQSIGDNSKKTGPDTKQQNQQLIRLIKIFFDNEAEWVDLKDHWKQKKKTFFKKQEPAIVQILTDQDKKQKAKVPINLERKRTQSVEKINQKMGIDGTNLRKFISLNCQPALKTTPTHLSFSYYWSQAKTSLDSFNFQQNRQTQFETRSEYNLYQWKSLRSLYRQNLKALSFGSKQERLRDFRMLSYVSKKEDQMKEKANQKKNADNQQVSDQLKKKVKLD